MVYKRMVFPLLAIFAVLCIAGCGTEKPKKGADEAVLAYAELYSFGCSDHLSATWMTEEQGDQIAEYVLGQAATQFQMFNLDDDTAAEVTADYVAKAKAATGIKARIKKDDDEHPVVELTATPIDIHGAVKEAEQNDNLLALVIVMRNLQASGIDLKDDARYQKFASESLRKYIDEIPMQPERTLDVTCELAKDDHGNPVRDDQGNVFWAPEHPEEVASFITGEK